LYRAIGLGALVHKPTTHSMACNLMDTLGLIEKDNMASKFLSLIAYFISFLVMSFSIRCLTVRLLRLERPVFFCKHF